MKYPRKLNLLSSLWWICGEERTSLCCHSSANDLPLSLTPYVILCKSPSKGDHALGFGFFYCI